MLEFGACPRCKMEISGERKKQSPVVCDHCGFTTSGREAKVRDAAEKRTMLLFGLFAAGAVMSFLQLTNWDNHSLEIIPLKIKETFGLSSAADFEQTAQICMDLKKWDCVEFNYSKAAQSEPAQLSRLGKFQMKRAEYNDAAQTYYKFFQSGGQNLEASYDYARALAQLGQVEEATKYFEQVLTSKPDVLQVTVVQNYVKLLMDHQRYDQARKLIQDIRGKSPDTNAFMETEFKKLQTLSTASRE